MKNNAYDYEHQTHSAQYKQHSRICVRFFIFIIGYAFDGVIRLATWLGFVSAAAFAVRTDGVEYFPFTLFVEIAILVYGGRFTTFVDMIGDVIFRMTLTGIFMRLADRPFESAFVVRTAFIAKLFTYTLCRTIVLFFRFTITATNASGLLAKRI